MIFQGINGKGTVVTTANEAQMKKMKANPAYNFLWWREVVEPVAPPAEVEDAIEPTINNADGNSTTNTNSSRRTKRRKSK
jgi:hypothetical protein